MLKILFDSREFIKNKKQKNNNNINKQKKTKKKTEHESYFEVSATQASSMPLTVSGDDASEKDTVFSKF